MASHCVIAAVDLNRRAEAVIRRAARLAQASGAPLLIAHVVEHHTGFESDHAPFLSPRQLNAGLAREARAWLVGLLHHMGLAEAEIAIDAGRAAESLAELIAERRARCLVTGPLAWGRLHRLAGLASDPRVVHARCDVLHGRDEDASMAVRLSAWAGRLLHGTRHG